MGSPYYSSSHYDEGRVHVYLTKRGRGYTGVKHTTILKGRGVPGERFGSTITNIGDVDGDGYVDVAIGAPGGGKGAVYIFNSNGHGLNEQYSQVLITDFLIILRFLKYGNNWFVFYVPYTDI